MEITYHEFFDISNLFRKICHIDDLEELAVHHEFSAKHNLKNSEEPVAKILKFLEERKIDSFLLELQDLKNLVTEEMAHPVVAGEILSFLDKGIELHSNFREERFI